MISDYLKRDLGSVVGPIAVFGGLGGATAAWLLGANMIAGVVWGVANLLIVALVAEASLRVFRCNHDVTSLFGLSMPAIVSFVVAGSEGAALAISAFAFSWLYMTAYAMSMNCPCAIY